MSSTPILRPIQSPARRSVTHTLLAIVIAASFFTTVVSLGAAPSAGAATMACCIGKPGHESGSCSTGLLEPVKKPQPEPEVLCGQEPPQQKAPSIKTTDVDTGSDDEAHCNLHKSSADDVTSNSATQSEPKASSVKSEKSRLSEIHSLSSPCSAECGPCSASYTRRPRPRDQSSLLPLTSTRLTFKGHLLPGHYPHINTLNAKWMKLPPRAPPAPVA